MVQGLNACVPGFNTRLKHSYVTPQHMNYTESASQPYSLILRNTQPAKCWRHLFGTNIGIEYTDYDAARGRIGKTKEIFRVSCRLLYVSHSSW